MGEGLSTDGTLKKGVGAHGAPKTEAVPAASPKRRSARPTVRKRNFCTRSGKAPSIVLVDDWDTEEFPYQGPEREKELLKKLREFKQTPPPGPFCKDDIAWEPIRTQSAGQYFLHEVAIIPWRRLDDFRTGEGMDKNFLYRFTKETQRKKAPDSLNIPRANSASKVIRY